MKSAVKVLIFDKDDNVLVLYRNDTHPNFPDQMDFPGGEIEENETVEKALLREIKEEVGLVFNEDDIKKVYEKDVPGNIRHFVYKIEIKEERPEIKLSWEHSKYEWIKLDKVKSSKIPENVDTYFLTVLEHLG